MAITITLPDEIEIQLQQKGQEQQLSVEELALEILTYALKKGSLLRHLKMSLPRYKQHHLPPAMSDLPVVR